MTEKDLRYVVSVLKGKLPTREPDWYAVLGFLFCHRIAGVFYNRAQSYEISLPKKVKNNVEKWFLCVRNFLLLRKNYPK